MRKGDRDRESGWFLMQSTVYSQKSHLYSRTSVKSAVKSCTKTMAGLIHLF